VGLFALIVTISSGFVTWATGASGLSIDAIGYRSAPFLHNLAGEKISSIEVGQQSMIRISVHNNSPIEQPFVILVEVRDGTDITVHLAWQSGSVSPNGDYTMETSWTPHAECSFPNEVCDNYKIRSFAITSLTSPQILSMLSETDVIKVTGSPLLPPGPRYYNNLPVNNQTFQIEYSFPGGKITQIEAGIDVASMTFYFMTSKDSHLTITMPRELVERVFPHLVDGSDELVVFVDEIPVDIGQTINADTGSFTFVIPLEKGSEEIVLVGSSII
jgi:hypothetical protein